MNKSATGQASQFVWSKESETKKFKSTEDASRYITGVPTKQALKNSLQVPINMNSQLSS